MSIKKETLQRYIAHLKTLSEGIERDYPHWFETEDESKIEGIPYHEDTFCGECAKKILDKFKTDGGDEELVSLRWEDATNDVPEHCEECGLPLWTEYTDHAIEMELSHYEEYGDPDTLNPEYKYEPIVLLDLAEACNYEDCPYIPRLLQVLSKIMPFVTTT